jgi:hypothetical protein
MMEPRDGTELATIAALTAAIALERDEGAVAAAIAAAIGRECAGGAVAAAIGAALADGAFPGIAAAQPPVAAAGFWARAAMAREWPSPVAWLRRS